MDEPNEGEMEDVATLAKPKPTEPLDPLRLREMLELVLEHAESYVEWDDYCLVGTAASMLQGVPLSAGDVDFLMKERAHVDAFAMALSSFPVLTPPTLLEDAGQYYAAYHVNGIKVEASTVEGVTDSDYIETHGDGPWKHQTRITVGPYHVPTVALELRLATELLRNRPDRYGPMITWMERNGVDADLLSHAMNARGIPQEKQRRILVTLK
jgi:hypothetical protein